VDLDLKEFLSGNWTLLLFVIIALGYLIAKIRLFGLPLGSTAAVLIGYPRNLYPTSGRVPAES